MSCPRPWPAALLAASLLACSPALNWRQVRIDGMAMRMLLPCKPDRAEREVAMGGRSMPLRMLGCDADGATFAVSHVQVPAADPSNPSDSSALLEGWKSAVLAHVHASGVVEQAWAPAGAQPGAAAMRVQAQGRGADGAAVALQAVWFAVADPAGLHLVHAVVLAPQARAEAAETFFSSFAPAP
ncbi:hypothetical protein [Pseudorhodoferax sp. Leaf274]|uniref:hypothetical protein n=1 Tax=Pseudorhodoferax sp. Leaf274 TaxID=1736318 RepID=UPI000703BD7B|nr:hypothetical protein [Pseudorhodoferax sp. Leaf274]KQP38129.1 hypothetical protein ASF44_13030 [Pseudorhodoferax sp. Leaf274]